MTSDCRVPGQKRIASSQFSTLPSLAASIISSYRSTPLSSSPGRPSHLRGGDHLERQHLLGARAAVPARGRHAGQERGRGGPADASGGPVAVQLRPRARAGGDDGRRGWARGRQRRVGGAAARGRRGRGAAREREGEHWGEAHGWWGWLGEALKVGLVVEEWRRRFLGRIGNVWSVESRGSGLMVGGWERGRPCKAEPQAFEAALGWERGEKPQTMGHQSRRRESEMSRSDDLEKKPEWEYSKKKNRN